MMLKKLVPTPLLFVSVLVSMLAINNAPVSAHEIEQNNGTSAVLHILPNDDPAVREASEMDFSFGSSKSGFNLQQCDCKLVVRANGVIISSQKLLPSTPGATQTAVNNYTFTKAASYTLQVVGKALDNQFPSFVLSFDQQVADANSAGSNHRGDKFLTAVLIGSNLAIFGVITTNTVRKSARYDPVPSTSAKTKKK